jgi:conjugal transfer pilus assembly protein TrbC
VWASEFSSSFRTIKRRLWLVTGLLCGLPGGLTGALPAWAQRIEALPPPATQTPLDLGAVAKGFAGGVTTQGLPRPGQEAPALRIFISLSMPATTLVRLADQAERSSGVLVLRGLVDTSLTRTVARLHEVFGERLPALQIDPQSFERYAVQQVPTFVLSSGTHACLDPARCGPKAEHGVGSPVPVPFVKLTGDVSLDYALAQIERQSPAFSAHARALLTKVRPPERRTP